MSSQPRRKDFNQAGNPGQFTTPARTDPGEGVLRLPEPSSASLISAYRRLAHLDPSALTDADKQEMLAIEEQVRSMEDHCETRDVRLGFIDQDASRNTIEASAILFKQRLQGLAKAETDLDDRDFLLEIPKLMGEHQQAIQQHEFAMVTANLLSGDIDTYQTRISNYDRSRRGKHQALLTRVNMAVRAARKYGIEALIYREVSKDVSTTDRHTVTEYSRNVVSLFS